MREGHLTPPDPSGSEMAAASARPGFRRAGAQHVLARRSRRRRRRAVLVAASSAVALGAGAVTVAWSTGGGTPATDPLATDPLASITRDEADPSTTVAAPSTPPNDLLAPAPTVVPTYEPDDGLAPLVHRVDTTDRVIFITIDDGQVRDPAYLDRFEQLGVPFTSFLTQPLAEAEPDYWTATLTSGGSIQSHTINHPDLRRSSEATVRREVCGPAETFAEMFGQRPTLFRPPYGNSNDTVRRVAAECGYRAVVHWTGSTNIGQLTMQDVDLTPGDIILMHYRDTLLADLDDVIARARAEGFRIARLEDYLAPG